jgi:hypothetical protein
MNRIKCYLTGEDIRTRQHVRVSRFQPQILHELSWNQTRTWWLQNRRLTAWATVRHISYVKVRRLVLVKEAAFNIRSNGKGRSAKLFGIFAQKYAKTVLVLRRARNLVAASSAHKYFSLGAEKHSAEMRVVFSSCVTKNTYNKISYAVV